MPFDDLRLPSLRCMDPALTRQRFANDDARGGSNGRLFFIWCREKPRFTSAVADQANWPNCRNATQLRPDALFQSWRLARRREAEAKPAGARPRQKR